MIVQAAHAEQPLFQVVSHRLTFAGCEQQPPRSTWRGASVASRGVMAAIISAMTNPRTFDWNHIMHYNPDAPHVQPAGVADEPFLTATCQRGCALAIERGRALGWTGRIFPYPTMYGCDAMTPAPNGHTNLEPIAIWPAVLPLHIRRAVTAGEHVMLLPQLDLGKTKTPRLVRDHRAAVQECFQVFVDDFNDLHRRGFRLHGSHILNCPYDEEILVMPFGYAASLDAVSTSTIARSASCCALSCAPPHCPL